MLSWVSNELCLHGILMDIHAMSLKVRRVADAMIRESFLPDFAAADFLADGVRIAAFDELHGALEGDVSRGRDEQMHVIWHEHEGMELKASLAPIVIEGLEEQPGVVFYDEESSTLEGCRGDEIRSGRRSEAGRFHLRWPSAAEAAS